MLIVVCACLAGPSEAAEEGARPKIGLVLGGGGAKGTAHVGVIKVLEELKIPVDYIAGTSMGAVVGSLYAAGYSADELERILTGVDWDDLFKDNPPRNEIGFRRKQEDYTYMARPAVGIKGGKILLPKAFIAGQKIGVFFETLFMSVSETTDFDRLSIPFRAVAADLETGEMVVLDKGRLADAARASMSVPGVFPPEEVYGRYLTDGGIVRNLPVDIVRDMGADILIAVDVGKPLPKRDALVSPFSVLSQMLDIMMKKNVQEQIDSLGENDILIRPDLGTIDSGDFNRAKEGAERGAIAARAQAEALKRYAVSDAEYEMFVANRKLQPVEKVRIGDVKVVEQGLLKYQKKTFESRLKIGEGDILETEELRSHVSRLYGLGDFERIDLQIDRRGETYDILLRPIEKSWGPNYLRFGLNLETNFNQGSDYNMLFDYTRRWVNRYGAEWKTLVQIGNEMGILTEFYQPLTMARYMFVAPYASASQEFVDVFRGDRILAEYRTRVIEGGVDIGVEPWSYGELRVGYYTGIGRFRLQKGEFEIPDEKVYSSGIRVRLINDQMDQVNFPRRGTNVRLDFYASMPGIGADDEYNKLEASFVKAFTHEKYTLIGRIRYGTYLGEEIPFYDELTLGGFLNLSGLVTEQLRGQKMGLGSLIFYWNAVSSLVGDIYLGGSLETGNVWEKGESISLGEVRVAGSAFVGYDSVFGPLYLAFGHADEGQNAVYLYLGRTF